MASIVTTAAPMPVAAMQESPLQQSLRLLPQLSSDDEVRYTSLVAPSNGAVPVAPSNGAMTAIKAETPRTWQSFTTLPVSSISPVVSADPFSGNITLTATPVPSAPSSAATTPSVVSRQPRSGAASFSVLPTKQTGSVSYVSSPQSMSHRPSIVSTTASAQSLQSLASWSSFVPPARSRRPSRDGGTGSEGPVKAYPVGPRPLPPAVLKLAHVQGQALSRTSVSSQSTCVTRLEGIASSHSSGTAAPTIEGIGSNRSSVQRAEIITLSSNQSTEVGTMVDEHPAQIFGQRSSSPLKSQHRVSAPAEDVMVKEDASLTQRLQKVMSYLDVESERCADKMQVKVRPLSAVGIKARSSSKRKSSGQSKSAAGASSSARASSQDRGNARAATQSSTARSRTGSTDQKSRVVWGGYGAEKSQQSRSKERALAAPVVERQHSRSKEKTPTRAADEALSSENTSTRGSVLGLPSSPYQVLNEWMASLCEPNSHRGEGFSPRRAQTESKILEELETQLASMREPQGERPLSTMRQSSRSASRSKRRPESVGRRDTQGHKQGERSQELVNELFGSLELITSTVAGDTGARLRHMQELVDATGSNRLFLRDHARRQNFQEAAESPKQQARRGLANVQQVTTAGGNFHYQIRADSCVNEELGRHDGSYERRALHQGNSPVQRRRSLSLNQHDCAAQCESSGTPQRCRPIARPVGRFCGTPRGESRSLLGEMP
mmetsp:Transcript_88368/g.153063  ORF Transcript_88368/g.153063 Transcript_88368/m.153063 type:complete len:721 (-) Transcript_88368:100-2262(-)